MLSSSRRPRRRFQCRVRSHHPPAQAFFSGLIGEVLADPQGFRERARAQATEIRTQSGIGGESTVVMFSSSGGFSPVIRRPPLVLPTSPGRSRSSLRFAIVARSLRKFQA
ncbi:MAG: hypothetical protein ACR2L9_09575 [Solirubrobacteraceae bacterium]